MTTNAVEQQFEEYEVVAREGVQYRKGANRTAEKGGKLPFGTKFGVKSSIGSWVLCANNQWLPKKDDYGVDEVLKPTGNTITMMVASAANLGMSKPARVAKLKEEKVARQNSLDPFPLWDKEVWQVTGREVQLCTSTLKYNKAKGKNGENLTLLRGTKFKVRSKIGGMVLTDRIGGKGKKLWACVQDGNRELAMMIRKSKSAWTPPPGFVMPSIHTGVNVKLKSGAVGVVTRSYGSLEKAVIKTSGFGGSEKTMDFKEVTAMAPEATKGGDVKKYGDQTAPKPNEWANSNW